MVALKNSPGVNHSPIRNTLSGQAINVQSIQSNSRETIVRGDLVIEEKANGARPACCTPSSPGLVTNHVVRICDVHRLMALLLSRDDHDVGTTEAGL